MNPAARWSFNRLFYTTPLTGMVAWSGSLGWLEDTAGREATSDERENLCSLSGGSRAEAIGIAQYTQRKCVEFR